jgi:hypothetical protein
MTNEQKAQMYGDLLNQHTRISNKIASIKGESLEMNQQQLNEIQKLQNQQIKIMNDINKLLS